MAGLLNFLTGVSLILLAMVLVSVRRQHIRVEYSMSWFGAALTLLAVSRWQWVVERLATALEIDSPALALLTVVGCLFIIVIFRFSVVISALKDANIALTQRIALLEYRIESAHEQSKT
jgi:hypothetical protein